MTNRKSKTSIKSLLLSVIGIVTYPFINIFNSIKINDTNHLDNLPNRNVLFVSNHQTYFWDVITLYHIFSAHSWGKKKKLGFPYYLIRPYTEINYVAASKTMNSSFVAKLFALAGAITVKRTWNNSSGESLSGLDVGDTRNISRAIENNWMITFPQGTTSPFAPGRKGTGFIIKQNKPIVIPVVIKGFSNTFSKKGIGVKRINSKLEVTFKAPLNIGYNSSSDEILHLVMDAIEQSEKFNI
jgi:1-acyl-sn-glycerol-3-phosphate acyltransferase